jgi:hypothetical protein
MWIIYILLLNDSLLLLYKFIEPKYHIRIEFRDLGIYFPFGINNQQQRVYFNMNMRKKIGTYFILALISYSIYLDNIILLFLSFIIPILLHIVIANIFNRKSNISIVTEEK